MTRERIKDFKEIVLPFFTNYLLKKNYENLGKSDAEEFEKDFSEIIELADKALEQQPCEDTISRQAAIDALTALEEPAPTARHLSAIYDCEDAITALSSAQPEQRWIPVSETVDVPEHEVLACDKYGTELIGFICKDDEQWMCESDECIMCDVVAWMPLPEPYKGGEQDG